MSTPEYENYAMNSEGAGVLIDCLKSRPVEDAGDFSSYFLSQLDSAGLCIVSKVDWGRACDVTNAAVAIRDALNEL